MSDSACHAVSAVDYGLFQVPSYNLNEVFIAGHGRISLRVKGFWSSEPVGIKLCREPSGWYVTVDHTTGGTESTGDPLDAESNFGNAVIFATHLARSMRDLLNSMEAADRAVRASG